ncbi:MAG: circadian clock KaiB family protein [Acidobacteria bacterium]|mgnify:FL=1|jgi:circadian clock protein KaiB|nr:circadian clock KaiB family protein [Acidobacteriota bacterium]
MAKKTAASKSPAPTIFKLRLFVAGETPKSTRAIANLKVLCEQHLKSRYRIEVIDLLEHPHLARGNQIVAIPTLEIKLPKEVRKIIGDLSDTDRVLVGLALQQVV